MTVTKTPSSTELESVSESLTAAALVDMSVMLYLCSGAQETSAYEEVGQVTGTG